MNLTQDEKRKMGIFVEPFFAQIIFMIAHHLITFIIRIEEGSFIWVTSFLIGMYIVLSRFNEDRYGMEPALTMRIMSKKEYGAGMNIGRTIYLILWFILLTMAYPVGLLRKLIISTVLSFIIAFSFAKKDEFLEKYEFHKEEPHDDEEESYEEVLLATMRTPENLQEDGPFIDIEELEDEEFEELKDGGFTIEDESAIDEDFKPIGTPIVEAKRKVVLPDESVLDDIEEEKFEEVSVDEVIEEDEEVTDEIIESDEDDMIELEEHEAVVDEEQDEIIDEEPADEIEDIEYSEVDLADEAIEEVESDELEIEVEGIDESVIEGRFEEFDEELALSEGDLHEVESDTLSVEEVDLEESVIESNDTSKKLSIDEILNS